MQAAALVREAVAAVERGELDVAVKAMAAAEVGHGARAA